MWEPRFCLHSLRLGPVETALLAWFDEHARDLPWRRTRDPYAILVSEVMLQQTQVARVVPRYLAWLERWPTVEALAAAPVGDVIREWQGLGYNRRAVNLHRAARVITSRAGRRTSPSCPESGGTRPTRSPVSRSTEPVLPVDTNVSRVLERTGGDSALPRLTRSWTWARPSAWRAMPRCDACPLAAACPSRGKRYEPLRKQEPFEGSFRQRRARALRPSPKPRAAASSTAKR